MVQSKKLFVLIFCVVIFSLNINIVYGAKSKVEDTAAQSSKLLVALSGVENYEASIVSHTIPSIMKPGVNYPITITVRNDGVLSWSESDMIRLGGVDESDPFSVTRHFIPQGVSIDPGQSYSFNFNMVAPTTVGVYTTDWRMLKEGVKWFGAIHTSQVTVSNNVTPRDATIISDSIPSTMVTGVTYPVTITVRNDGSSTWSMADSYYLGAVGDSDYFAGGRQPIQMGKTVGPGQTYTFSFKMVAPSTTGTYVTDWRMVQDGVEWYGKTLLKSVNVVMKKSNATIIADTIPSVMATEEKYPVTITVRNDGNTPWSEQDWFRLAVGDDSDPFFAGGRIFILNGETVLPGNTYTFSLIMTAPQVTGSYITDWIMVHDGVEFFGNRLSKTVSVLNQNLMNSYRYDSSGRLQTVKYHSGHRMEYLYDLNGNTVQRSFAANLLDNSSFENDLTAWIHSENMGVSTSKAKTGKKSLRYNSTTPKSEATGYYLNATSNTNYTLSTWMQNNLTSGNFYVDWVELDANNNIVVDGGGLQTGNGSSQWGHKLINFTTSAQTKQIVVRVIAEAAAGEAFVDDIQLNKLLINSNFEDNSYGWSLLPSMSVSNLKAKDGNKSIRFYSAAITSDGASNSMLTSVTPKTTYKFSAWLLDSMTNGQFYIDCLEYDSQNKMINNAGALISPSKGSGLWSTSSLTFTTKSTTTRVLVRIVADSSPKGEAYADLIKLEKQ